MAEQTQIEQAVGLPPAGDARRDELRQRHDKLMEEAEKISEELQLFKPDPTVFNKDKIPREVHRAINDFGEVWVSNADPNYRYSWVFRDPKWQWGGRWVGAMKVLGWELVSGQMKEAWEHRVGSEAYRIISDCILMRTRLDNYLKLQQRDRQRREALHEGVTSQLDELADKYGVTVKHEVPESVAPKMESQVTQQRGRIRRRAR